MHSDTRALFVLVSVFLLMATILCFANPLFESTDEIRHYRFIRVLITEKRLPVQGEEPLRAQSHHPPLYYTLSAILSAWVPSEHTGQFDQPLNPYWGYRNWEVGVDNKLQYWHAPAERRSVDNIAAYIPRLLNVVLGAMTVALTFALSLRVWPASRLLALAPAALVALNPQFIYLSAAINNDVISGLLGTALLYACLVLLQDGLSKGVTLWLGILFGLGVLSKIHLAAFAPVIVLAVGIAVWRQRILENGKSWWVHGLKACGLIFVIAGLMTGWWFVRNFILYGDLTGMNRLNELWGGRQASGNFWALQQGLPYLWSSMWGRFGYGQIPLPSVFYSATGIFCAVGLIGHLKSGTKNGLAGGLAVFTLAVLLFLAIVSYYILIQPAGAMGRFLFPIYPIFAVIVIAGWAKLVPSERLLTVCVLTGMACFSSISLVTYWYPAVGYPASVTHVSPSPGSLQFASADMASSVAQVSDISLFPESIHPGEPVFVTVTWYPLEITSEPYSVFVHLVDDAGAVIAQRDTWPGLGRAPTTSWRVGGSFVDVYRIDVPESVYSPNHATVRFGLYNTAGRLPLTELVTGDSLPEGAVGGEVEITALDGVAQSGQWPNPLAVNFDNQVELVGYTIEPRRLKAGQSLSLTLYWETLRDPDSNYAVFAQVLDQNWQVWGSKDGGNPGWKTGAVTTEQRIITLLPETPAGTYPIQIGVFDARGRLPVVTEDGRHLDDRFLLGPIRVDAAD